MPRPWMRRDAGLGRDVGKRGRRHCFDRGVLGAADYSGAGCNTIARHWSGTPDCSSDPTGSSSTQTNPRDRRCCNPPMRRRLTTSSCLEIPPPPTPAFFVTSVNVPVAIVVEQLISIDVRHVKVRPSVVVIIAHCRAHPVAGPTEPRLVRNVGKTSNFRCCEKSRFLCCEPSLASEGMPAPLTKIDVEIAVAVVIEERDSRNQPLGLLLFAASRCY